MKKKYVGFCWNKPDRKDLKSRGKRETITYINPLRSLLVKIKIRKIEI